MQAQRSFEQIVAARERPLLVLAHQDDELACSGILQRLRETIRVVFMTNGDALAQTSGLDPVRCEAIRKSEALGSLEAAGVSAEHARFLGYSEIEIYRNLAKLKNAPLRLSEVVAFFEPIRRAMAETVYEFRPDIVFAVGFQGGHPEHDLAHFFAAIALRNYARDAEADIPLYHFPDYEVTALLPARFRPWWSVENCWIVLDRKELETKQRMADCYHSRRSAIKKFRIMVGFLTLPQRVVRRENPVERFFRNEQISLVPRDFDYRRVPYRPEFLNYILEDFQGTPITFQGCIRSIVVAFEEDHGTQASLQ